MWIQCWKLLSIFWALFKVAMNIQLFACVPCSYKCVAERPVFQKMTHCTRMCHKHTYASVSTREQLYGVATKKTKVHSLAFFAFGSHGFAGRQKQKPHSHRTHFQLHLSARFS